jgi:hypothetical protein
MSESSWVLGAHHGGKRRGDGRIDGRRVDGRVAVLAIGPSFGGGLAFDTGVVLDLPPIWHGSGDFASAVLLLGERKRQRVVVGNQRRERWKRWALEAHGESETGLVECSDVVRRESDALGRLLASP